MDLARIILKGHQGLDFGTVAYFVKKHEGEVSTIDVQKVYTHKVNNNQESLAMVIKLMKGMQESKQNGNLTFTLTFANGESKKLMVQDVQRETAKNWG